LGYFLGLEAGEQNVASYIGQFEIVHSLTAAKNRKRGQGRTRKGRTGEDGEGQNRTGKCRTKQGRAGQGRAEQDRRGQGRTGQDPPELRKLRF
jgi:hypothetical protein